MVQSLPPVTGNGWPACVKTQPPSGGITTRKCEEFRTHLQKALQAGLSPQSNPSGPERLPPADPPREVEMSPDGDASRSLAPEGQPSLCGGGGELAEWLSLINPSGGVEVVAAAAPAAIVPPGVVEVTELVERWVRRAALGGDQRRGAVRLDIGQGRFSGAELTVVAESGRVSVELRLPANLNEADLSERLRARLERRGYTADVVVRRFTLRS